FGADLTSGTIISFGYGSSSCQTNECHTLILRNLIFGGRGVTQDAARPAKIRLLAEDCVFTRLRFGVFANGPGFYQFKNCVFQSLESGLNLSPNSAAQTTTLAVVEGCRFEAITFAGIDGNTDPQGGSVLKAVARDSLFDHLIVGVRSNASAGGSIQVDLERCEITNGSAGRVSVNSGSVVRVSDSTIVGKTNCLATPTRV